MAAKFHDVRQFPGTRDQLIQASQEAAQRSGFKIRQADPATGRLEARAGFSFWSYGENISVQAGDGTVDVRSECLFPTQLVDWGKNKRNVNRFFGNLAALLPQGQPPSPR
jgi:hypothetical protein